MSSNAYKRFSTWCFNLLNTSVSVIKVLLKSKRVKPLPKVASEKCLVLGTGPSLKDSLKEHADYFQKHELLCVNTFVNTAEFEKLKPKYYLMLDPAFWKSEHISVLTTRDSLIQKTVWSMYLLLPFEAKGSKWAETILQSNQNIRAFYFNYTVFKGFDSVSHYFYRKNMAMPQSQNVLVAATFMAINLGFKRIELFGADHNWHEQLHVTEENIVCVKQLHFYENIEQLKYVPFYRVAYSEEIFRMDEIFNAWAKVFYGYQKVKSYAVHRGTQVINASKVSFIDAFERVKISNR